MVVRHLPDWHPPARRSRSHSRPFAGPTPLGRSDKTVANRPDFWSVLLISSSIYSVSGTARCFCCWWYSSKSTFSAVYSLLQRCRLHWHQLRANSTQWKRISTTHRTTSVNITTGKKIAPDYRRLLVTDSRLSIDFIDSLIRSTPMGTRLSNASRAVGYLKYD